MYELIKRYNHSFPIQVHELYSTKETPSYFGGLQNVLTFLVKNSN
jgi:hypothetical protein